MSDTPTPVSIYAASSTDGLFDGLAYSSVLAPKWSAASSYALSSVASYDGSVWMSTNANANRNHVPGSDGWWAKMGREALSDTMAHSGVWRSVAVAMAGVNPQNELAAAASKLSEGESFVYAGGIAGLSAGIVYTKRGSGVVEEAFRKDCARVTGSVSATGGVQLKRKELKMQKDASDAGVGIHSEFNSDHSKILFYGHASPQLTSTFRSDGKKIGTTRTVMPSTCRPFSASEAFAIGEFCRFGGNTSSPMGLYVAKKAKASGTAWNASDWACVNDANTMFTSANPSLIRDVIDTTGRSAYPIATVGGAVLKYPIDSAVIRVKADSDDGTAIEGETVRLYEGTDASGTPMASETYNAAPIYLSAKLGMQYFITITNTKTATRQFYVEPKSGILSSSASAVELRFKKIATFSQLAEALPKFSTTAEADAALRGMEIADKWTAENGTQYTNDSMVCTAVKDYVGEDDQTHRGAKMERKYATLHPIEFCTICDFGSWKDFGTINLYYTKSYLGGFCYCGGRWIATSRYGGTYTKTADGNWGSWGYATENDGFEIAFGNTRFFGVAEWHCRSGVYARTENSGWVNLYQGLPEDYYFFSIAYGPIQGYGNSFIISCENGSLYHVPENDGYWYELTYLGNKILSMAYGNGLWAGVSDCYLFVSSNGTDWSRHGGVHSPYNDIFNISYIGGKFVILKAHTPFVVVFDISTGAVSDWSQGLSSGPHHIAYGNGTWAVVTSNGVFRRTETTYWVRFNGLSDIEGYSCGGIAYGDGKFSACSIYDGNNRTFHTKCVDVDSPNSNYANSTIRQYLNSSAAVSAWHEKKYGSGQQDPAEYDTIRGYVAGCSSELMAHVKTVKFQSQSPSGEGGARSDLTDRFFIDSATEKYGVRGEDGSLDEGTYDGYWKASTEFTTPSNSQTNGRIAYKTENAPTLVATDTHLRSPNHSDKTKSYCVSANGSISNAAANTRRRVQPCCVIW